MWPPGARAGGAAAGAAGRAARAGGSRACSSEASVARDAHRRHRRAAPRQDGQGSVSLARGREEPRGPGVDDRAGRRTRAGCSRRYPGRDEIAKRVAQLFYYDAVGAPIHHGEREFYTRKLADEGEDGRLRRRTSAASTCCSIRTRGARTAARASHGWWPSWDGKHVAYAVSEHNSDETVMHVIDVATGKDLPDVIEGTKYAAASWTPDGQRLLLHVGAAGRARCRSADRPGFAELRFHTLGSDPAKDPIVHEATQESADVPRRRRVARRSLAARGRSSTAGTRATSTSATRASRAPWQALVEGVRRELRRRRCGATTST